jgi:DNA-binding MarR family transcriptional regulator
MDPELRFVPVAGSEIAGIEHDRYSTSRSRRSSDARLPPASIDVGLTIWVITHISLARNNEWRRSCRRLEDSPVSSAVSHVTPEICSCSALRQAARHLTRLYDGVLAPAGIGLNQYSILAKLERFGPQILQDLAGRLVMDRSTLGHLLRPLTARRIVKISPPKDDRRQRVISLTPAGLAVLNDAKPLWAKAEQHFQRVFGANDAFGLRVALKRVTAADLSVGS